MSAGKRRFEDACERGEVPDAEVMEMRVCEIAFLILRPGQLYRFTVDPDCARCRAYFGDPVAKTGRAYFHDLENNFHGDEMVPPTPID